MCLSVRVSLSNPLARFFVGVVIVRRRRLLAYFLLWRVVN